MHKNENLSEYDSQTLVTDEISYNNYFLFAKC